LHESFIRCFEESYTKFCKILLCSMHCAQTLERQCATENNITRGWFTLNFRWKRQRRARPLHNGRVASQSPKCRRSYSHRGCRRRCSGSEGFPLLRRSPAIPSTELPSLLGASASGAAKPLRGASLWRRRRPRLRRALSTRRLPPPSRQLSAPSSSRCFPNFIPFD
jgi:hypothetical protein